MNQPTTLCGCSHDANGNVLCSCNVHSSSHIPFKISSGSFSSSNTHSLNDISSFNSSPLSPQVENVGSTRLQSQQKNPNILIPELDELSNEEQILDIDDLTNIGQLNTYLRTRYGYPPFLPILRSTYLSDIAKLFLAVKGRFKDHSTLVRVWIKNISESHGATLSEIKAQIELGGVHCTAEELDGILSGNFLEAVEKDSTTRNQDTRLSQNMFNHSSEEILLPELNWESFQYFMDQEPSEPLNEVDPKMLTIPSSDSDDETSNSKSRSGASGDKNKKQYTFLSSSRSRAQTYFKATRRMIQKAKQIEQQTGAIVFMAVARPTNLRNAVFHVSDNIKAFEPEAGVVTACSKMFQKYVESAENNKVHLFKQLKDQNRIIKEQAKELERIKILLASQPNEIDRQ
ncbi:hypothetical protein K7432_015591 [Basidiobolus ranarum]|uniref:Uncharacterized protein n=1 Tax=Basidiobolus ranarum TaxID=34480 RepID=A0ABR2WFW8_9FUNG